ncbi:MAG TPA: MerR family transcriptional regulator [Vicinamibacterales bacterium]|nr:MerR family transcriptional regulator [Vicinamibacterales bacterium]
MTIDASPSYRVHEFAELAGVTVKTLHHYDRLGLLKPGRTAAGYRVYTPADLPRLEQIVALKALGLSLKDIRALLDRDALPLQSTFRQQREVLEEKRRLLDRAIQTLTEAEQAIASSPASATPILQKVIRAMTMQDIDVMRKYYSDEAWIQWRRYYEEWPSPEWQALYRDLNAALDLDPASDAAQQLADRWMALFKRDSQMPAIRTGLMKAWADREHWPPALRRRMAEFNIERATEFVNETLWVRWDREREARAHAGAQGMPSVTESRRALFREWAAALDVDPGSPQAQTLAARWRALLDAETHGDEEIKAEVLGFFRRRRQWPAGMKRYVASLYGMDAQTWERVTDLIERAAL